MVVNYLLYNMRNEIPLHCIDSFMKKFGSYPSICSVEPPYTPEDFIVKTIHKYHKLWEVKTVNEDGNITYLDVLLEYDPTGILLYIKDNSHIFILSGVDKSNIVDFTIHNLKKNK